MTERDPSSQPIRVLLVDDDPMVCTGIRLILRSTPDIEVVGMVHDGSDALIAVDEQRPDVVLMDVRMPRMDGITATGELTARGELEPVRVLVLTTFEEDTFVVRAIQAGAAGFLLKTASPDEIIAAVRSVAAGHSAISPASAGSLFRHVAEAADQSSASRQAAGQHRIDRLSPREREIAELVWAERSNPQISAELYLSESTVKTHLSSIQTKLGVASRVGIARHVEQGRGSRPSAT